MLKVVGLVFAGLMVVVLLIAAGVNSPEGKRHQAHQACLETVKLGDIHVPVKSASEREACIQRVIDMADPNKDPNNCDAMHRDETGVWVWTKSPEERAACQAGRS